MFKRLSKIFICLFLSIITLFGCSSVEDYSKYLTFEPISATECSVKLSENGYAASKIVIPNKYKNFDITSISSYGFECATYLKEIVIPDSVTSIESHAFWHCNSLTSIVIPNSVSSIGSNAFYVCTSLTSVTIGNSVTSIGSYAFYYCDSLTSIVIPNSVTTIGSYAFEYCYSLTSITLPFVGEKADGSGATHFGYIFGASSYFANLYVPTSLKEVIITGGDSIKSYAFYYCDSLTSIVIPNSVTSIGAYAFDGCISLKSIVIPDSVTSIGFAAFSNCSSLTFYCEAKSEPSGWGFDWNTSNRPVCWGVTSFIDGIEQNGIQYSIINGEYVVVIEYVGNDTEVVIPSSIEVEGVVYDVTSIANSAFEECSSLTNIVIPDSVTSIGAYAFENCSSLTSIVIPNSVTSIGKSAFYGCKSLTIYCEASSKPSGWDRNWNYSNCPVIWGWKE